MKPIHLILVVSSMFFISLNPIYTQSNCLKKAWIAYNAGNYQSAIIYCDKCIDDFSKKAKRQQKKLETAGKKDKDFTIGNATKAQQDSLFKNWVINDVSTACFIKGRSAEYIYEKTKNETYKKMATKAYNQACFYPFGRCWDLQGWFWSPCQESLDRLPLD